MEKDRETSVGRTKLTNGFPGSPAAFQFASPPARQTRLPQLPDAGDPKLPQPHASNK